MSYNGSGTFNINSTGQPVVAGTVITASAFNALTTDLATGLTTAITKDGQTTTTARITFAQGITSSLTTDSSSVSTGSIITAGGAGIAKNLYVGGALDVAGATTFTNPVINNIKMGYTTTATAAGTTTLTISSNYRQFFTGTLAQTIVLPVTSTLVTGIAYEIENNSTGTLTVNSSGGNLVGTVPAGVCAHAVCIGTTLTTAADWDWDYISTSTITGTGANVLGTSPTITTPTISSLSSAAATALTLQSAGTTAITVDTSQNVGIGTTTIGQKLVIESNSSQLRLRNSTTRYRSDYTVDSSGNMEINSYDDTGSAYKQIKLNGIPLIFSVGSEAMRIDSSGNVGIGTSSPSNRLHVKRADGAGMLEILRLDTGNYTNNDGSYINWTTSDGGTQVARIGGQQAGTDLGNILFETGNGSNSYTERARIDSSGNLLVGTTNANAKFHVAVTSAANPINANVNYASSTNTAAIRITKFDNNTTTAQRFIEFVIDAGATGCGQINANGASAAAFGSYSDSRLKENITNLPSQLANIMALRPVEFDYIQSEGGGHQIGFIAQEVNEIYPDLVGERADGMFTLTDLNKNDARLIKAIQELKAINDTQAETINALTARITALENA